MKIKFLIILIKGDYMKMRLFLLCLFLTFFSVLYHINNEGHSYYTVLLDEKLNRITYGTSARRGRILDRNGVVLVDNEAVLNLVYHKPVNTSFASELSLASTLKEYVTDYKITDNERKNYYLVTHNNGYDLITPTEWQEWEERKLNNDDIASLKKARITKDMLTYSIDEEKIIYLFTKMNDGYSFQDKVLLSDLSDEELARIMSLNNDSLSISTTSKRVYPYEDTLKSIFGSIGSIPKEEKDEFLRLGYSLDDIVGISGLEKEYEEILKGKKAKYVINSDNTLTKISEEEPGTDLVLNIDISINKAMESILKEELNLASAYKSAKFFHDAYMFLGNPLDGSIIAMSGIRKIKSGDFQDITITSLTSSFAMGSVVKGASNTVGYQTGAIEVGKKVRDSCVKLWSEPSKCSYKRLGLVDDITSLKTSSNYYQFLTAIKSTGQTYKYNMRFSVTEENFKTYRETFKSYGLGNKTGIDYPTENTGILGNKVAGDLLLNLAIGQYDTYTPISLLQYMNTIANDGNRYALRLKKEDYKSFLNQVNLDSIYFERIKEGMYQVFHGGTASNYIDKSLNAVGKTGTSETFYDSDNDGTVDTSVINSTLAFYYPRENPTYTIVVVAPYLTDSNTFQYPFTKNVSKKLTKYLMNN